MAAAASGGHSRHDSCASTDRLCVCVCVSMGTYSASADCQVPKACLAVRGELVMYYRKETYLHCPGNRNMVIAFAKLLHLFSQCFASALSRWRSQY